MINSNIQEREKYSNKELIKDIWHFIKPYKTEFFVLSSILAIASLLGLVPPIIIARIIDYFITGEAEINIFFIYLGVLFGVMVGENVLTLGTKHFFNLYAIKIQKIVKVKSMQKVIQGDLLWHDTENTGNKMQRVSEGERAIEGFLRFYFNQGIGMFITLFGIIGIFAFFNLKYALVAIVYLLVYSYSELRLNKKVAEKVHQIKLAQEVATGKAYEFSSNISTIKSLGIEKSTQSQIQDKEELVLQARKGRRNITTKKWLIVEFISAIFFVILLYMVGYDILVGILTVGSIVIYVEYIRRLGTTMNFLSNVTNFLIEFKEGFFRMIQIHKAIPEYNEKDAKNLKDWKEIRLKDVEFNYKKEPVLNGLTMNIKKGEKVGIVGPSGTGKSTLFKLLLKLYLPKKGEIYFDNTPITKIKRDSVLDKISIVPQEIELFNLSLKENVVISETGRVNKEKYARAINISQTDKTIQKMKDGEHTMVGEKGVRLSGGERQRLGIARAIYKDSEIIIFDEATSNLDYVTEKKILEEMDKKLHKKTLIIAAHRLDTLKAMDRILFIEKGKLVEEGTYTELLKQGGKFAKLLDAQRKRKAK